MTKDEFPRWLDGFLSISGAKELDEKQLSAIKKELDIILRGGEPEEIIRVEIESPNGTIEFPPVEYNPPRQAGRDPGSIYVD